MSSPAFGNAKPTWQEIAAEASRENDHNKLMQLTKDLERALDERDDKPDDSAIGSGTP